MLINDHVVKSVKISRIRAQCIGKVTEVTKPDACGLRTRRGKSCISISNIKIQSMTQCQSVKTTFEHKSLLSAGVRCPLSSVLRAFAFSPLASTVAPTQCREQEDKTCVCVCEAAAAMTLQEPQKPSSHPPCKKPWYKRKQSQAPLLTMAKTSILLLVALSAVLFTGKLLSVSGESGESGEWNAEGGLAHHQPVCVCLSLL